jgi:hypothetical protein
MSKIKNNKKKKMSSQDTWNDFLNEYILSTGNSTDAALVGIEGNIWAISEDLTNDTSFTSNKMDVNTEWLTHVLQLFEKSVNDSDLDQLSITLFNKSFLITNINKNKVLFAKNGLDGIIICKTNQALLIVCYGIANEPSECLIDCECFVKYLIHQDI